jgi:hypothetical protein
MSFDDTQQECMGWYPCEQQMTRKMLKDTVEVEDDMETVTGRMIW